MSAAHPINEYLLAGAQFADNHSYDGGVHEGARVNVCRVLSRVTAKRTKSGVFICNHKFSDLYHSIELTAFESTYNRFLLLLKGGRACAGKKAQRNSQPFAPFGIQRKGAFKLRERLIYVRLSDKGEARGAQKVFCNYPVAARRCACTLRQEPQEVRQRRKPRSAFAMSLHWSFAELSDWKM